MLYYLHNGREKKMKKKTKRSTIILLVIFLILVLAFVAITVSTAKSRYAKNVAEENITEPDFYAMQEFCGKNAAEVMKALKANDAEKLKSLMLKDSAGIEDVLGFAKWEDADFENVTSLGAGSLSAAPDKKGRMDISERFFVNIGEQKYVLYIETLTSRHGMINSGVSVVGATTYEHFDELDYNWNGDSDDASAVAGKSFVK